MNDSMFTLDGAGGAVACANEQDAQREVMKHLLLQLRTV